MRPPSSSAPRRDARPDGSPDARHPARHEAAALADGADVAGPADPASVAMANGASDGTGNGARHGARHGTGGRAAATTAGGTDAVAGDTRGALSRVADPDPAWPATASLPVGPSHSAAAELAILLALPHALTRDQRRWLAAHGAAKFLVPLVPVASLADGTFQLLAHRAHANLHTTLLLHHLAPPSRGDAVAGTARAGRAGLHYYLQHAPLLVACEVLHRPLHEGPLGAADVRALWARLARELRPALAAALAALAAPGAVPAGRSPLITQLERQHLPRTAQACLWALAVHPALPEAALPALLTLALDPLCLTGPDLVAGAEAAFGRYCAAAARPGSPARALAPEGLAPFLAVASSTWRVRLLTELLPVLDRPSRSGPTPAPEPTRGGR